MKITTFTAVAFSIALSGLAHADGPRPGYPVGQAPVPPAYDQEYLGQDGAADDEYFTEERYERRREVTVAPGVGIAPPAVLPLNPGYAPNIQYGRGFLPPPFPPHPAGYCKVLPSRISPDLTTLIIFTPGQQPFAQDLSRGPALFRTVESLKVNGYCRNLVPR